MRAIDFVTRLIDEKPVTDGSLRRMLIHSLSADDPGEARTMHASGILASGALPHLG
jgi:hypothetical protein